MMWVKGFASALLLGSSMIIAATASTRSALAAVPSSGTVVIRGSNEMTAPPSSDRDPPVVLRGSRPSPALPPAAYACPSGNLYDSSSGCAAPGYTGEPYDYGYWPSWGFDGFYSGSWRHRLPNRFAGRTGRKAAARFARSAAFGRGFAHLGGFTHTGGFGHR
jgi:hypothetical protein